MNRIPQGCSRVRRPGFTLVELLVAVTIMLTLVVMTTLLVNFNLSGDRVRGGGRQVFSLASGAADRAVYAKSPRGIRLILDPNGNGHTVNSIVYVGAPKDFEEGLVTFDSDFRPDNGLVDPENGHRITLLDTTRPWQVLYDRGYFGVGSRIQIPAETGAWYRVASRVFDRSRVSNPGQFHSAILLDRPCLDLAGSSAMLSYRLELRPEVLPGTSPVQLPNNTVIDLDSSVVPNIWRPLAYGQPYGRGMYFLDILFSPRGDVIGDAAALGKIHLVVADRMEVESWQQIAGRSPANYNTSGSPLPLVPANNPLTPNEQIVINPPTVVSISTRTGRVTNHRLNLTNTIDPAGLRADDPFRFAEVGEAVVE